jgi:primosomal protein N' (replication factor Y)
MLVDVALPVPLQRTFTYQSPQTIAPGTRVHVRFNGRRLTGWVIGPSTSTTELERISDIESILENEPSVPPDLLALCKWIAEYYVTPLGLVIRATLPVALSGAVRPEEPQKKRKVVRLVRELPTLLERAELFARAPRQRELYELLENLGGAKDLAHLTTQLNFGRPSVQGLVDRGLAVVEDEAIARDPFASMPIATGPRLQPTPAQSDALARLRAWTRAQPPVKPVLLHGVTGSGKTLVYIELLREVLRQDKGAIVLVPEIALTPQTVARFRAQFGDTIAVLHSALGDGERYDAWLALHRGERRIAIGARSAIFAPVRKLGAIVVDEEHEASYKHSDAPRYHARELAIVRARLTGAVCLLGSATPSLESWHNAQRAKFEIVRLPERVEGRPLPPVRIIDLRLKRSEDHDPGAERSTARSIQPLLAQAIEERLERGEQTILLLNRRGYSTFVQCRECGNVWACEQCNVSLTFHRARRRLVCHYCFREEAAPTVCPKCRSIEIAFRGVGTEQVEREVIETFPAARVSRMDVDTTSAKWSHHEILGRVERGEVDILLGTQMIAKGLDFPSVTLVGVINADVAMNLPDFRAGERTFQLLTQVAGRAGRGPRGGEVLIQTALPQHYAIRCALDHDYETFALRELEERASPRYPPHVRLANVVISGTDEYAVQAEIDRVADGLRADVARNQIDVELVGPAPCPIDRIRGRWRWHFLLRSKRPAALLSACRLLYLQHKVKPGRADLRLVLDRDPVTLL